MTKETIIGLRVSHDEIAALDDVVAGVPLMNRSQYIKAALNSYSQKVIFR